MSATEMQQLIIELNDMAKDMEKIEQENEKLLNCFHKNNEYCGKERRITA